ncbi:hypothetical protein GALMADRAFT_85916 [Galerina marginata CBS 339.88]|uniref:Uncharacterized protein n=1 Tax=Galerina marginata (strain CBS 339.88) TaxID=685588 RepID=A0A067TKC2_GALM3|nr:hypothetical protein GALMADRAFT_85916 [Galerina marginata CBS 339.88]
MTNDILDPSAVLSLLPTLLPPDNRSLASPQDGIAALVHAALSVLAFRLIAVDESSSSQASSSNVLPSNWNKSGPGNYAFKYRHDQSSLEFLVKLSKLGTRAIINAIALESDKVATLDIATDDFTSPSFYPYNLDAPGSDVRPLVHGFISSNRVSDFLSQFKLKIVQKLVPGLRKDGYTEETGPSASSSANTPPRDPVVPRPRPRPPPDAPDHFPYLPRPEFPRNPLEIGRRDLDPFPTNPFAPASLFPPGSGDGMFVGPEHPIFGMGRANNSPGIWGGDGYLPPMGAPPGARFDPVGPVFPNRNRFGPAGRGRQPENPDNDEFMPPGTGDMFM